MKNIAVFLLVPMLIFISWWTTRPSFRDGDCVKLVNSSNTSFSHSCCGWVAISPLESSFCETKGRYCYVLSPVFCNGILVEEQEPFSIVLGEEALAKSSYCSNNAE